MLDNINKFPVIIVSSPRTGSTALQEVICKKYNLKLFNEPHWKEDHFKYFVEFQSRDLQFCLKVHSCDLRRVEKAIQKYRNQSYWISLKRRDVVDQIASFYLARKRDKWFLYRNDIAHNYEIDIDKSVIADTIYATLLYNNSFDNLGIKYDLNLYYEDLDLQDADLIPMDYPDNYDELKNQIIVQLEEFLKWQNKENFKVFV